MNTHQGSAKSQQGPRLLNFTEEAAGRRTPSSVSLGGALPSDLALTTRLLAGPPFAGAQSFLRIVFPPCIRTAPPPRPGTEDVLIRLAEGGGGGFGAPGEARGQSRWRG